MDSPSTSCLPPSYPPPPSYSFDARPDERTVSRTARRQRVAQRADSHCAVKGSAASVTLLGQPSCPTYGRGGVLDGTVRLTNPKRVVDITVTLEGRLKCSYGDGGQECIPFLSKPYTLWNSRTPIASQNAVHDDQPFSIPLPLTFSDDGAERSLPASYEYSQGEFRAQVSYRLVVRITARRAYLPGLTSTRRVHVHFEYKPRLRPPRPSLPGSATLFETLKVAPDEWTSVALPIRTATKSSRRPLNCEVAFPSSRIFSAGQNIPVHVQLSGDAASLSALALARKPSALGERDCNIPPSPSSHLPTYDECSRPGSSCSFATLHSFASASSSHTLVDHAASPAPRLSVTLERRVTLRVPYAGVSWRSQVLAAASFRLAHADAEWAALDGVLALDAALDTPGPVLRVGPLTVCDFLVIAGDAGVPEKNIPVILVSDAFADAEEAGESWATESVHVEFPHSV
ncbi:hypothetical protein AURDEDRAFT_169431 [Auricularia subglabra TFB-10046 SS5]|nr:hypothetical protein AURDEDRAFT_169431 [Auricularia subglabra TFB-10046 SS5]